MPESLGEGCGLLSPRPASALALQTPHPGEAGQQPSFTSAQKMGQTPQGSSRERLELVVATLSPASAWAVVDFIEERVNEERDPTDRRRKAAQPAPSGACAQHSSQAGVISIYQAQGVLFEPHELEAAFLPRFSTMTEEKARNRHLPFLSGVDAAGVARTVDQIRRTVRRLHQSCKPIAPSRIDFGTMSKQ